MNSNFLHIIAASHEDRRGLFLLTANRLGTPIQNVEKDFWVSLTLDLLFNGRIINEPRLLFKGGTSLSKAYGLISRFSEDIDITLFREDIGHHLKISDFEKLSGKQRRLQLENIKKTSQTYIQKELKERLNQRLVSLFREAGVSLKDPLIVQDPDDPDQQTLLVYYPSVSVESYDYIKPVVKIEAGARSALDPHCSVTIQPYVALELPHIDLTVNNIIAINPERTFWDKVVILHGLRRWHDNRGVLRQQGHRTSRHYYDLYRLTRSSIGEKAITDRALALECARHAKIFFNSTDLDLQHALPGLLTITPTIEMIEILKRDYQAMSRMIFGEIPTFSEIVQIISELENKINSNP